MSRSSEKISPLHSTFQGHSMSLETTWIDLSFHISDLHCRYHRPIFYHFWEQRWFQPSNVIFSTKQQNTNFQRQELLMLSSFGEIMAENCRGLVFRYIVYKQCFRCVFLSLQVLCFIIYSFLSWLAISFLASFFLLFSSFRKFFKKKCP